MLDQALKYIKQIQFISRNQKYIFKKLLKQNIKIKWLSFIFLFAQAYSISNVAPAWSPCQQIQVASHTFINYPTTTSTLPDIYINITYAFVWPSTTLPRVVLSVNKLHTMQSLTGIAFYCYQTAYIGLTDFQVQIQINQPLYYLQMRYFLLNDSYIAIDSAFPYHLNAISNLNIISGMTYTSTTTSTLAVYYPSAVTGSLYTQFTNPFTNYKIFFFLTCLKYMGTVQTSVTYPPVVSVTAQPTSIDYFTITVTVGVDMWISYLHGTFIIFDYVQISNSMEYILICDSFVFTGLVGGQIPIISQQYQSYTFMGITDFNTSSTKDYIDFQLNFGTLSNGSYGLIFSPASAQPNNYPTNQPADYYRFTVFYMQQLLCPNSSYYLDLSSIPVCISCQIILNCNKCKNSSYCTQCMIGYELDTVSISNVKCKKIVCSDIHCNMCSSATVCTQCDYINKYYVLPDGTCGLCDSSINMFINASNLEYPCEMCIINNCLICSSLSTCQQCQSPYVLNMTDTTLTGQCIVCPIIGCLTCTNITHCSQCDYNNNYGITVTSICQFCNSTYNPANNIQYYINSSSYECQLCTIPNCIQCISLTQCKVCNISANYYNDNITINHSNCLYCNSSDNYFLVLVTPSLYICQLCNLQQCVICQSLAYCKQCNISNDYVLNTTSLLCQHCSDIIMYCVQCINDTYCNLCNQTIGYYVDDSTGQCLYKDSNADGYDYSLQRLGCNGFVIVLYNYNVSNMNIDANSVKIQNSGIHLTNIEQNSNSNTIKIRCTYDHSIIQQNITLLLYLPTSPSYPLSLSFEPSSSLVPLLLYSETECQDQQKIENYVTSLQYIAYLVLFVSMFFGKLIGLQLFGMLQIAYFSLGSHDYLNIHLSKVVSFRVFNGFNANNIVKQSPLPAELPQIFSFMGVRQNFINNCNVMLVLSFAVLFVAALLYVTSALILHSVKLYKFSIRLLKQGFITVIIFNCCNISFSAAAYLKYWHNNENIGNISNVHSSLITLLSLVSLCAIFISALTMQIVNQDKYGQFKNKFKENWFCKMYVPLIILYRMIICIVIAVSNEYIYSTLLILIISFAFTLYLLTNLPFKSATQNYRSAIVNLTVMYVLLMANYYATMKSNTPLHIKGYIFTPTNIMFVLIGLCVFVSVWALIYEAYKYVQQYIENLRKRKTNESYRNTQSSIAGLG